MKVIKMHINNQNNVVKFPKFKQRLPSSTSLIDPYFYQKRLNKAKKSPDVMTADELKGYQKGILMAQVILEEEIENQSPKKGA